MLSKFKILDNLRRTILPIVIFFILIIFKNPKIVFIALISYIFSSIIDILNSIIFKKGKDLRFIYAYKNFVPKINYIRASMTREILEISFLPHKVYILLNSIVKTIYRMNISKKHLLEWITSEQTERQAKEDLGSYYKFMWANIIFGIYFLIIGLLLKSIFKIMLSILWIFAPIIAWYISKDIKVKRAIDKISENDIEYLKDIGKRTWQYFKDNINEENNYLPPDNYQEDRIPKIAQRTSTTNIGLGMISIISAYDLKYIKLEEAINLIQKMLDTVKKLKKWKGQLFNWYNTNTLEPLFPRYISTVDNGNFIGYMYTTKQFLISLLENNDLKNQLQDMIKAIDNIIEKTDFSILYDNKKHLLSIGYDVEQGKLTNSYYDLLASEARQASLIAIAKKDISPKHWNYLSRTLTSLNKYKGLISWSGTAFEYLMPNINIKEYEESLLDESCRFLIYSQIKYAKKLGIPFRNIRSGF